MSIIKELKSQFSLIAWCPIKEYASVMVIASAKDLTPSETISTKTISLYDWNLENVDNSRYQAQETLLSGATSLCWGSTVVSNYKNAVGLICVGLEDGSIQFYAPCCNETGTWTVEIVSFLFVYCYLLDFFCEGS